MIEKADALRTMRAEIDKIDRQIHDLLTQRAQFALKIAQVKVTQGGEQVDFYRPQREAQILQQIKAHNHGPLTTQAVANIFGAIMQACRDLQIKHYNTESTT